MINLKRTILIFFLIYSSLLCAESNTAFLKYNVNGSGSYYPFHTNNPDRPGILPEIINKILDETGITAQHINLPTKRIAKYLINETIDFDIISLKWLNEQERNSSHFIFSDPLVMATEVLVSRPENEADWNSLDNVKDKNVGTVLGYYYHDDDMFNRVDFPSEKELIIALDRKRIDVIIIDKLSANYWANQLGIDIAQGALHSHGLLKIRLLSKHKKLLPRINQAIKKLHSQGIIKQIENKYINNTRTK